MFCALAKSCLKKNNDISDENKMNQSWPKAGTDLKLTDFGKELLKKCMQVPKPDGNEINIETFMQQSLNFPVKFGRDTCRVMSQPNERYPEIIKQIASAYPIIHERVIGNDLERPIHMGMTLTGLVQRLLEKRCVAFLGPLDDYLLLKGKKTMANFFDVGTTDEKSPLLLKDVLSYDEIKLSAFLSVSSHTEFLNNGRRYNCGIIEEDKNKIVTEGVIIGIIGGRFEAEDVMEWQDIMITPMQNTKEHGYGYTSNAAKKLKQKTKGRIIDYRQLWMHFYEEQDMLYDKVKCTISTRFFKDQNTRYIFDNLVMKKRYAITFDTMLLEANARGVAANKQIYLHVVGIGLGAWRAVPHQDKIFFKTFSERLRELLPCLTHVAVVHFSNFRSSAAENHLTDGGIIALKEHPYGGIKTFIHDRYPSEKLPAEYENMLLIVSYAWDGNALPGNEFWKFGINTCRVMSQPKERHPAITKQIASAYPLIHERVLGLYLAFLEHKSQHGNNIERAIYTGMTLTALVQRLLEKRCASFYGCIDNYLLVTGEKGYSGFCEVGTSNEKAPLKLMNVLSYDEIKLSAFLSISSQTDFINDGNRYNEGIVEMDKSKIEPEGVVIGMIGGRFQVKGVMEWQDIMITAAQNTKEQGYGYSNEEAVQVKDKDVNYRQMWKNFYEEQDLLYENVKTQNSKRFFKGPQNYYIFDNLMMKKRYAIAFDTLLLEAEVRGVAVNKQIYIHIVGIGLGSWRAVPQQEKIFLETFDERLQQLLPHLSHIGVVHFSYFVMSKWQNLQDGGIIVSETHPNGGIQIFMHNRNPSEKLTPEFENMLIVESYAWAGNALPGNDFWLGALASSGDPAAACSTLISELHNPHINTKMVNGENLHIASTRFGVLHIAEYAKKISASKI